MSICPFCNGFLEATLYCSKCGHLLLDCGKQTDFVDAYSPYEETNCTMYIHSTYSSDETFCVHTFFCEECLQEYGIPLES